MAEPNRPNEPNEMAEVVETAETSPEIRSPVLVTALGVEQAALRTGLGGRSRVRIVRVGIRARRLGRLTAAVGDDGSTPVVVAGVAGALDPSLRPGDVVVADEARRTGRPVGGAGAEPVRSCPAAEAVAAVLRRSGLTVRVGTVLETARMVDGAERTRLAGSGALAADLESWRLLAAVDGHPAVVVRVVADTPRFPLRHPAIVPAGVLALRSLSRLGPHLIAWAESVTAQQIPAPHLRAAAEPPARHRLRTTSVPDEDGPTIGQGVRREARFE